MALPRIEFTSPVNIHAGLLLTSQGRLIDILDPFYDA